MIDHNRSAAIWYAADGFDPKAKGLNGRRVAGESFLRGFFQHAEVDVLQSVTNGQIAAEQFAKTADPYLRGRQVENFHLNQTAKLENISTVFYPSPTLAAEAWRRFHLSQTQYSICGITHTTATSTIMNGFFSNRCAPLEPWDGVICTSKSVLDHVQYQQDLFDEYAKKRFGCEAPAQLNATMIPLGIHTQDFIPVAKKGAALRQDLGIAKDDVVFLVLSRLSAHEKFDPIPMFRALRLAQEQCDEKIHLILCGYFPDKISDNVFTQGAQKAMPRVKMHVVDGKDAEVRAGALSAADVFLFPIDNLQETFGLAPVEAMAAGLPLIVSDWDGMKDTVTADVGFRIPTRTVSAQHTRTVSRRYQTEVDTYQQYTSLNAAMTQIDVPLMADKMVLLTKSPGLRRKMGKAGQRRAQSLYDWKTVIPATQDYWAELTAIRLAAKDGYGTHYEGMENPNAPNSGDLFAGYPTAQGDLGDLTLVATAGSNAASVDAVIATRGYKRIKREIESSQNIKSVLNFLSQQPGGGTMGQLIKATKMPEGIAERSIIFLLKYDLLREA